MFHNYVEAQEGIPHEHNPKKKVDRYTPKTLGPGPLAGALRSRAARCFRAAVALLAAGMK